MSILSSRANVARRVGRYTLVGASESSVDGPLYRALDGDTVVRLQFLANPEPDRVQDPEKACLHPCLEPVLGSGQFAGLDYLVLPEDTGRRWQYAIAIQPGDWWHQIEMILEVASAVASMHARDLLHLRLDASHVRDHGSHLTVHHAGTARDLRGRASLPCLGPTYGIAHPAPEQCLFGAGLTRQTDVYQLGVLLAPLCGIQAGRDGWTRRIGNCPSQRIPESIAEVCTTALRRADSK
ncbi:MAG: hypothetical protein IPK97_08575, partial [Ahniella sp.]|nr:hypothetical protein [Ahniella sp.]